LNDWLNWQCQIYLKRKSSRSLRKDGICPVAPFDRAGGWALPLSFPYARPRSSGSNLDGALAHVPGLTELKESDMPDFVFLAIGLAAFGAFAAYARLLARL
jgi:hypothetical protein